MRLDFKALAASAIVAAVLGGEFHMAWSWSFDSAKWKAERGNTSHKNPRIGMVSGVEGLLRVGMTREEVVALLGEPDDEKPGKFTYDLGASPVAVDFEYFVLEFDGAGKLTKFRTEQG